MNMQINDLRQRLHYYVHPANSRSENEIKKRKLIKLEETAYKDCEVAGLPVKFTSDLVIYETSLADVEKLMRIEGIYFNVYVKSSREPKPRFGMRKSPQMKKHFVKAEKPTERTLLLVPYKEPPHPEEDEEVPLLDLAELPETIDVIKKVFSDDPELAKRNAERLSKKRKPKKRILKLVVEKKAKVSKKKKGEPKKPKPITWSTYLISTNEDENSVVLSLNDKSTNIAIAHIRQALLESGMSPQSVGEREKIISEEFNLDEVWEANGDVLFRLWRYARRNPLIRFAVFYPPKNGDIENAQPIFSFPKTEGNNVEAKILRYNKK
jgi:hypothetical protein